MRDCWGLFVCPVMGRNRSIMAQIHALTPEGRLPSGAVEHVQEIAVPRTTGWRDVSEWVPNLASGRFLIRRTGLEMIIAMDELVLSVGGNASFTRFPTGLRPLYRVRGTWFPASESTPGGSVNISGGGYCNVYNVTAGQAMSARIVADFPPGYAWPSPEPGTPA